MCMPIVVLLIAVSLFFHPLYAQISLWQIGGGGLAWETSDTTRIMIDVDGRLNRIRPVYFGDDDNMF